MTSEKDKVLTTEHATVTFRSDGILHIDYTDHYFSLEDTKTLFKKVREESPWEVSPIYLSGNTFSTQDAESRKFNGSHEVTKHCSAIAMLVKTPGQRLLANFFIRTIKPAVPTRFFTNEESAIEWLKNYL